MDIGVKVLGVIPARIGSVRIPKKMLADVAGKSLIRRAVERSSEAESLSALVVATDSGEIAEEAESAGARVIRSLRNHANGTERVAEAVTLFTGFLPDIVVTIWGDEPMYPASVIDATVDLLLRNPAFDAVIPSFLLDDPALAHDPSIGKVVADNRGRILYLSRSPIPYNYAGAAVKYYHASGALAMRREFLKTYVYLPRTGLEAAEDVEQLRILEAGYSIGTFKTEFLNRGVNTPEDYAAVVAMYRIRESGSASSAMGADPGHLRDMARL